MINDKSSRSAVIFPKEENVNSWNSWNKQQKMGYFCGKTTGW